MLRTRELSHWLTSASFNGTKPQAVQLATRYDQPSLHQPFEPTTICEKEVEITSQALKPNYSIHARLRSLVTTQKQTPSLSLPTIPHSKTLSCHRSNPKPTTSSKPCEHVALIRRRSERRSVVAVDTWTKSLPPSLPPSATSEHARYCQSVRRCQLVASSRVTPSRHLGLNWPEVGLL
jgi:hypothetical protein